MIDLCQGGKPAPAPTMPGALAPADRGQRRAAATCKTPLAGTRLSQIIDELKENASSRPPLPHSRPEAGFRGGQLTT